MFLSDEGATLETLDFTVRIDNTPTFLYFDLCLYTAYAAHCVYFTFSPVPQDTVASHINIHAA